MSANPDVLTYGVIEQTELLEPADRYVEECRCNGYTVIADVFSSEEMKTASRLIDDFYHLQCAESGGEELLRLAKDEDLLRCPLAYDDFFLGCATKEPVQSVLSRILGKNYVLMMQNAILNRSNKEQYQARWHRDLNYQHWTSSQPISLNFLVAIDDFFEEGGSTWVLPGSHHYATFPSDEFIRKFQCCLEAKAGSVIVMDSMMYHRAGVNRKPGFVRRGLNHVVGLPFMGQQIDIPAFLGKRGKDFSGDPFLANYLGYRWNPAPSVEIWRRKHAS